MAGLTPTVCRIRPDRHAEWAWLCRLGPCSMRGHLQAASQTHARVRQAIATAAPGAAQRCDRWPGQLLTAVVTVHVAMIPTVVFGMNHRVDGGEQRRTHCRRTVVLARMEERKNQVCRSRCKSVHPERCPCYLHCFGWKSKSADNKQSSMEAIAFYHAVAIQLATGDHNHTGATSDNLGTLRSEPTGHHLGGRVQRDMTHDLKCGSRGS